MLESWRRSRGEPLLYLFSLTPGWQDVITNESTVYPYYTNEASMPKLLAEVPTHVSPWLPEQVELVGRPTDPGKFAVLRLWLSVARSHTPCPSTNQHRLISKKMARCLAKLTPKCP